MPNCNCGRHDCAVCSMPTTSRGVMELEAELAVLREQLAEARARGRLEGLEEAAALAQGISHVKGTPRDVARELRGLVLCVAESHASHTKENPHG